MTTAKHRQRGMSMIQALLLTGVAVFFGLFAIKVGPAYMEYLTVAQVADDISQNTALLSKPRSKIYAQIQKAYKMNNLWDLDPKETIMLEKHKGKGFSVRVKYEKRANLFSNIYVVTTFDKKAGQP